MEKLRQDAVDRFKANPDWTSEWDDPQESFFIPVKESLESGEAGAVGMEQFRGYREVGMEKFDMNRFKGEMQIVDVCFGVDTVYGTIPIHSRCLLSIGRRVEGWLNPVPSDPLSQFEEE